MGCGSSSADNVRHKGNVNQDIQSNSSLQLMDPQLKQPQIKLVQKINKDEEDRQQPEMKLQIDSQEIQRQPSFGQYGTTIKEIVIIPPFDSQGNLQDEILKLKIKSDVQTNLKKMQSEEMSRKQILEKNSNTPNQKQQNEKDKTREYKMQLEEENDLANKKLDKLNQGDQLCQQEQHRNNYIHLHQKDNDVNSIQKQEQKQIEQDPRISNQKQLLQKNLNQIKEKSAQVSFKPMKSPTVKVVSEMREFILSQDLLKMAKEGLLDQSIDTQDEEDNNNNNSLQNIENINDSYSRMGSRTIMEMENQGYYKSGSINDYDRNILKEIKLEYNENQNSSALDTYHPIDLLKLIREERLRSNQSEISSQKYKSQASLNNSMSPSFSGMAISSYDDSKVQKGDNQNNKKNKKQDVECKSSQKKGELYRYSSNQPIHTLEAGKEINEQNKDQDLNRKNTFDTINDTISNVSPINNSSNKQGERSVSNFNNEVERLGRGLLKKQETAMTDEIERIVKGLDEKNSNNDLLKKSEEIKEENEMQSKDNFQQLMISAQSNSIYEIADKNSVQNSYYDKNESYYEKDEFQVSVHNNAKMTDSKVLHTTSLKEDINEDGNKKINNYIIMKELGRGNCGKVKLGQDQITSKFYAIKIANKDKLKQKLVSMKINAFTLLQQEIAIMKKIDHPNIVKLHEVIEDSESNKLYIVMDFMERGSILSSHYFKSTIMNQDPLRYQQLYDAQGNVRNKHLEPKIIDIKQALKYMRQMALALDYMHNFAEIVHRDIKPDNLLVDAFDNLKVADFGISQLMEKRDETSSNAGTKAFMAPETWDQKVFKATPLDIWATGITLYFMIYGQVPFREKKMMDLKNEICSKQLQLPDTPDIPQEAKEFLYKMLEKNPEKRITAKEMLVDPWLTNNGQVVLKNIIDHSLEVDAKDLEKAIGRCTKFTASVMIALGFKRKLKKTRQSLNLSNAASSSINRYENQISSPKHYQKGDTTTPNQIQSDTFSKFSKAKFDNQDLSDSQQNGSQSIADQSLQNQNSNSRF